MNKLTLRTVVSPYDDTTKGAVLTQAELDNNFISLKGEVIVSATTSGNTVSLVKYNGDTISFTGGSGSGSTSDNVIVPISKFLIFKIGTGTPDQLEVGDLVQGIVENKKIEAIYLGGDTTLLTSFNVINFIDLYTPPSGYLTLFFNDIDSTTSNLGISDKNSIIDWNNFFSQNDMSFDVVEINGNSAKLIKNDVTGIYEIYCNDMELINIELEWNGATLLHISNNEIVSFDQSIPLPSSLESINLNYNQIVSFDPSIALPSSLTNLELNNNQIVSFNPSIALPNSLTDLYLGGNQIVSFDPNIPLPSSLTNLDLSNNEIVSFNPSIALPNSLSYFLLNNNQIVSFNPSIALPSSLSTLFLNSNQIVTASWENDTNYISNLPNNGFLNAEGNVDSILGTASAVLFSNKNWSINA